jgi:hypothetical protein
MDDAARARIDTVRLLAYAAAQSGATRRETMHRFAATFSIAVTIAVAILATPGLAQEPKPPTPAQAAQQQRMSTCNADASQRNLKGDARQTYMTGCLGGKMNQTTLMKVCNAQASQDKLSANDRKAYLSTCLKKSG